MERKMEEVKPICDQSSPTSDMLDLLKNKRSELASKLQRYQDMISNVEKEYLVRLTQLKEEQKPLQEALQHIDALLRLSNPNGDKLTNAGVNINPPEVVTATITDEVCRLLETVNQPMHYRDIYNKLVEKGLSISGKDAAATLLARISRDARFKRGRKRGTYALSVWRIPTAKSKSRKIRKRKP
jgi:hypothetical protein